MPYVQWPPLPTFKSVVASNDVYLNVATPLTVIGGGGGGGTAPGNVPAPVAGTITSTTIEITFDVAAVTGTQPITYEALVSDSPGGLFAPVLISPPVGSVYTGTASGLTPNTPYYFKVRATNTVSFTESTESEITTAAGGGTPPGNVPNAQLLNATSSIITTYIDTSSVTGDAPITYFSYYGLVPGTFTALSGYNLSTGSIYVTSTINVGVSTTWYFETRAQNAAGTTSTIAPYPAFSTLGLPTAPTAPGAPQVFLANNGSLISTLYFDVAGVTGTPPITYDMYWTNTNVPEIVSSIATVSSGSIYTAVVNDLPTTNALYQIVSRATNAVGSAFSDNTAVFGSTIAGPVTATPSTMSIGLAGVSQTAIGLSTSVILSGNPQPEIVAQFGTVSSSLISTTGPFDLTTNYPSVVSTIGNLPGSTIFYFNTLAYNSFGSTINTTITAISTLS